MAPRSSAMPWPVRLEVTRIFGIGRRTALELLQRLGDAVLGLDGFTSSALVSTTW